jgi:hypothetical protein
MCIEESHLKSYLVLMWSKAKVFHCLSGILGASQKEGVGSSRSPQSQLVEGQAFTASGRAVELPVSY